MEKRRIIKIKEKRRKGERRKGEMENRRIIKIKEKRRERGNGEMENGEKETSFSDLTYTEYFNNNKTINYEKSNCTYSRTGYTYKL